MMKWAAGGWGGGAQTTNNPCLLNYLPFPRSLCGVTSLDTTCVSSHEMWVRVWTRHVQCTRKAVFTLSCTCSVGGIPALDDTHDRHFWFWSLPFSKNFTVSAIIFGKLLVVYLRNSLSPCVPVVLVSEDWLSCTRISFLPCLHLTPALSLFSWKA